MGISDIANAIKLSGNAKPLIRSVNEFNAACIHVVLLLEEAVCLYECKGYSTATFLAITALEEVAKAHCGSFSAGGPDASKKKNNLFHRHGAKHRMAATETVSMGSRLKEAIGLEGISRIEALAHNGGLLNLRETSLYFDRNEITLKTPRERVDKGLCRIMILYAIEAFDDALVGMTSFSMEESVKTDALFERVR